MAVFVGGCAFEAVERVVGEQSLDGVASLLDKSLVRQDQQPHDTRLTMLETVRQYPLEPVSSTPLKLPTTHSADLSVVAAS